MRFGKVRSLEIDKLWTSSCEFWKSKEFS